MVSAGRSPAEAGAPFFGALQQAVSCVTTAVLQGQAQRVAPDPHVASFARANPVRIGQDRRLSLQIRLLYRFQEVPAEQRAWRVSTVGYFYELFDRDERGVLAYHWHPVGASAVTFPHLHIGGRTAPVDLSKAHLPTGFVTLIDVLRLAIIDLGVEPLRPDWRAVFDQADQVLAGES